MTDPLPQAMVLRPGRLRWLFVGAVGWGFVVLAIFFMPPDEWVVRWLAGGFFALVGALAMPGILGIGSRLELDRNGFTCKTLLRTWRRDWADCSEFQPISVGPNSFVGFSTRSGEAQHPSWSAMNRAVAGTSGMLPENYGRSVESLAGLMNAFRARALGLKAPA
jgi:hypothetical protein